MIPNDDEINKVVKLLDEEKTNDASKLLAEIIKNNNELEVRHALINKLILAGGCYEAYDECIYVVENLVPTHMTYMYLQNILFWLQKYDELKLYANRRMELTKNLGKVSAQSQVAFCMACIYLEKFDEAAQMYHTIEVDDKNSELVLVCKKQMYYTSKSRIKKCLELKNSTELLSVF